MAIANAPRIKSGGARKALAQRRAAVRQFVLWFDGLGIVAGLYPVVRYPNSATFLAADHHARGFEALDDQLPWSGTISLQT